jgi:SAM-dependent methyltransferase
MSVFSRYAAYYDLLYQDKNYVEEAQFIDRLLRQYGQDPHSILDLGCGTGRHAALLANQGYLVHGVDTSANMLQQATQRQALLEPEVANRLQFSQAEIDKVQLFQTFDAVVSLFHVISYQTSNQALQNTFQTVKSHLKPGGVFIFDIWYGPAVLHHRPSVRVKRVEDDRWSLTRIAEPTLDPHRNCVTVQYQIWVQDKTLSTPPQTFYEHHQLRYLFQPEIELLLLQAGLHLLDTREWLTAKQPSMDSWSIYFVASA